MVPNRIFEKVAAIEGRIIGLQSNMETLSGEVTRLQGQIRDLGPMTKKEPSCDPVLMTAKDMDGTMRFSRQVPNGGWHVDIVHAIKDRPTEALGSIIWGESDQSYFFLTGFIQQLDASRMKCIINFLNWANERKDSNERKYE